MFRATLRRLHIVHSPRGVPFSISADDAIRNIQDKYSRRWFGAQLAYLNLSTPRKEFLPFYLCRGEVHAVFTGTISYNESGRDDKGNPTSSTRNVYTQPQKLNTVFEPNRTQVYAGYKYNIHHVHAALKSEQTPLLMKKMSQVDTKDATLNLFEQSTSTMREFVEQDVRAQVTETAATLLRSFHPSAASISVNFEKFDLDIEEITPVFVPCYIVKSDYDGVEYHLYVSGFNGYVGGPYLLNALYFGRLASVLTVAGALLIYPNKVAGFILGSFFAVFTYYVAFYAAKTYPKWRRDYYRKKRDEMRQKYQQGDRQGFRPDETSSRRTTAEYHSSTYWDTHAYQQRRDSSSSSSSSTYSGGATRVIRDQKGYYKILGLEGNESINEIRSAYRKIVLQEHPDVGGSEAKMVAANEAYRVLRDPKRRAAYDRGG